MKARLNLSVFHETVKIAKIKMTKPNITYNSKNILTLKQSYDCEHTLYNKENAEKIYGLFSIVKL